ncbi:TerD family protein [Arthrobacter yangruifuii]|uniref:Chemical-damaging agent resistance protein C n=1 Tax=Arthrobacter yangruifuii TaxID=2606616 RepID=A0A5N6MF56_9MICC|nr:TerD family protein [Arthrobacter yangruifuii]KAD3515051.1 chemical-damaging agent resistance protein C [Arthrobacter yangruifuii]
MGTLVAGANAALTGENPGLTSVLVGLGWDVIPSRGPASELVPLTLLCGADGRVLSDAHLVFFNQIASPEASVTFQGDDDTEQIDVDLSRVPDAVSKIVFAVYADPEMRGPGTFAAVRSAYIRVARPDGRELVRFDLPAANRDTITAMMFGELYRHRTDWKFRALGQGYTTGLRGLAADFGFDL